jgi:hypothetical protein
MKALIRDRYGPPEVLDVCDVPAPFGAGDHQGKIVITIAEPR